MESFRTVFFPKVSDRTKVEKKCDSAPSVGSNYDRYKRSSVARDADKLSSVKTSGQSS